MQFDAHLKAKEQEMADKGQIAAGKAAENTEATPHDATPSGENDAASPQELTHSQLQAKDELLRVKDLELANLQKQSTDAAAAKAEQDLLHANIQKQAKASSAELLQLQSALAAQQQHNQMLTQQLQLAEQRAVGLSEVETLKTQLAEANVNQQKLNELQGQVAEKESLIGQLRRDVDAAQTEQQTSLQHSRDIFARQKGRIQDLEEDLTAREKEFGKSVKSIESAEAKLEKLAEQQAALKAELSEARSRIKELESLVSQRDRMLASAEKEADKLAKKHENATDTLQTRIGKLQADLEHAKQQRADMQSEMNTLKSQRTASDKQVQQLQKAQAKAVTDQERRETAHTKKTDTLAARLVSRDEQITGLKELVAELKKRPAAKVAKSPAKAKQPAVAKKTRTKQNTKASVKAKPSKKKSSSPARKAIAKPKAPAVSSYKSALARFKDTDAKVDRELGIVFGKRPKQKDDLKKIEGVGPAVEKKLNKDGVFLFQQIALWNKYNIWAFDQRLGVEGRISQEKWMRQAKELAKGTPRSTKKKVAKKTVVKKKAAKKKKK